MNKILSVTLAISLMAILLVGCSAENGKIGNGVNGTVGDNTNSSGISSMPNNNAANGASGGVNENGNNGSATNPLDDIGNGISEAVSGLEEGMEGSNNENNANNGNSNNTANGASKNESNNVM